jgi:hypothetical protein
MGAYRFVGSNEEPDNSLSAVTQKKGQLQGIVILATWRSLQPTPNSELPANNQIDQGLAAVRKYNAENPDAPLAVKLRVWGGAYAPDWVMNESGGRFDLVHTNVNGKTKNMTLGHVWTAAYRARWVHLQELLAAKYDAEPLVHEVAATSCMMFTAEPFFIDTHPGALEPLRKAGLTDADYKACLNHIVDDYAAWKTTRFETPLNPFESTDGAKPQHELAFTLAWIRDCHQRGGERCVLDNHDLEAEEGGPDYRRMLDAMKSSGADVEFQTFRETPTDTAGTIRHAVDTGASSVELWQDYGGFPKMTNAELKQYSKLLLDAHHP